jgi:hypothetical protein
MSRIGRLWAGRLFGTNTGNLFAEFESSDGQLSGTVRLLDDRLGPIVYSVTGNFDGNSLEFTAENIQSGEGVLVGGIGAKALLTPEGHLRGEWSSTIGTGGTFVLFPHDVSPHRTSIVPAPVQQLHTARRSLGALRLFSEDIIELIDFLRTDFSEGRVIITYRERKTEISVFADDFANLAQRLGELRYLKLFIREPEAHGINRLAIVELNAEGTNDILVQGTQESWVVGKAEALSAHLTRYQRTLSTTFRKFGLNINGLLFVITLILLPDLSIPRPVVFVSLMLFAAWIVVRLHSKYIPNASIYLSAMRPSWYERAWPQFLSWLIAASAAIFAAIVYGLLKGELSWNWTW